MNTAAELLHERGYNAVGVGEICARAGVNKGSFYHFFPSKQQLALDVVDAVWRESRSILEESLLGEDPPLERLVRYLTAVHESHARQCASTGIQKGCPLANLALEMSTQDPLLRERLLQSFESHIGFFERLLKEAKGRGDLPTTLEPRAAAEELLALLEGKILLSKLRNDPECLRSLAPTSLRLLEVDPAGFHARA